MGQLVVARARRSRQRSHDDAGPRGQPVEPGGAQVTQPSCDAIAHHGGGPHSFGDDKSGLRGFGTRQGRWHHVHHQRARSGSNTRTHRPPEVLGTAQTLGARKHRSRHSCTDLSRRRLRRRAPRAPGHRLDRRPRRSDQTARRLRPLPRRAEITERPARVRIRRRKPCVLARRRLFGWKVRLLTAVSGGRLRVYVGGDRGALHCSAARHTSRGTRAQSRSNGTHSPVRGQFHHRSPPGSRPGSRPWSGPAAARELADGSGPHRLEFRRHAQGCELPVDNRLSLPDRSV